MMQIASRLRPLPLAAGLLAVASAALAAPAGNGQDPAPENLSPTAMLSKAKESTSKMQDMLRRVVELQQIAKKAKDIIKVNCVNDKLLQVKGHIAVSDQAMSSMNEALAKSDTASESHEYTRISILAQKAQLLGTQAENCIGADLSYVGDTITTMDIDPSITDTDPTAKALPYIDVTRPPAASSSL